MCKSLLFKSNCFTSSSVLCRIIPSIFNNNHIISSVELYRNSDDDPAHAFGRITNADKVVFIVFSKFCSYAKN